MSDIVFDNRVFDRLREIGDQSQRIGELESEIARLRLTDEEREAIEWFSHFGRPQNGPVIGKHAAALRGLLERLG